MTRWIKIKEEELRLLLEFADSRLKEKFLTSNEEHREKFMTAIHYLRINQAKLPNKQPKGVGKNTASKGDV